MRRIDSVQALRALAAMMVVVGHSQAEALNATGATTTAGSAGFRPLTLLPWGAGVDIFFVISGFIMVVSSERLFAQRGGAGTFLSRRLKRIVPLYWLATSLYIAIELAMHKPLGLGNVAASYLFWPHDVYGDGILRPIYALGWTLNYEMFFYVLFALAILLPRRVAVATVTAALLVGVLAGQAVDLPLGPLSFWSKPIVLEFAFGMGIGLAWSEGLRLPPALSLVGFGAALAALGLDGLDAAHKSVNWTAPNGLSHLFAYGMPAAVLVGCAALSRRPVAPTLWMGGAVAVGEASYALYLVHPFVVLSVIRGWKALHLAAFAGYWPFVILCILAATGAAIAVHRWVENPLGRLVSGRRREVTAEPAPRVEPRLAA